MIKEWLLLVDFILIQLSTDIFIPSSIHFQLILFINKQHHAFHI